MAEAQRVSEALLEGEREAEGLGVALRAVDTVPDV